MLNDDREDADAALDCTADVNKVTNYSVICDCDSDSASACDSKCTEAQAEARKKGMTASAICARKRQHPGPE